MDIKQQLKQNLAPVAINQVHRSALSIGALKLKLGHLDSALESIYESIKISQSKNDDMTVLEATLWLHTIIRQLGGKQERMLVEHLVHQSTKLKHTYIFILSMLNYATLNLRAVAQTQKMVKVLKAYKAHSQGGRPIWNDVLMIVQGEIVKQAHRADKRQMISKMQNILLVKQGSMWQQAGGVTVAGSYMAVASVPKERQTLAMTI
jgi:hypothetical protein